MSAGNSSVMVSSSSSSSSSSSATKVGELIEKFNKEEIRSCVIGISHLKYHDLNRNIAHAALLITDKKRSELSQEKSIKTEGILLEYGYYPPDEEKAKKEEEEYVKNGLVIYRYKEKGGLRYYTNTFENFQEKFCDVGYIILNLNKDNQISFRELIDRLAPQNENRWIKTNYYPLDLMKKSQNCQDFVCHCIDILKSPYEISFITKGKISEKVKPGNRESIVPTDILKALKKYEI